ncbi:MAG: SMP-30/gluconolactonase/LRE family protein [Rhodothermales bacterium]|nr:SMP-30/gluconolactonase/LRE family protein [Rhodothermales bacterium]
MKTRIVALFVGVLLLINSGCQPGAEPSATISQAVADSETVKPVLLAEVGTFSESPVFDKEGNIYVSEPYGGPITRVTPTGEVSTWAETKGANGHRILEDGTHLVCDRVRSAVLRLDPDGNEIGLAASSCGDHPLRAPNDLALDQHGGFYFTDPSGSQEDPVGRICYVDAEGDSHWLAEWEGFPNGIAVSPDERTLYVAEFNRNEILTFPIESPGKIGAESLLTKLPEKEGVPLFGPDGMAFGPDGNLFVAHFGMGEIHVLSKEGKVIRTIDLGDDSAWSSNLNFGAAGSQSLYVTGNSGPDPSMPGFLYRLKL